MQVTDFGFSCYSMWRAWAKQPVSQQGHQPVAFPSVVFPRAQVHCFTYDKKVLAVVETLRRLNCMLVCFDGIPVFRDHRNFLLTLYLTAVETSLSRQKRLKVIKCALIISAFSYKIGHVPRVLSTMTDIMTRRMQGYCFTTRSVV